MYILLHEAGKRGALTCVVGVRRDSAVDGGSQEAGSHRHRYLPPSGCGRVSTRGGHTIHDMSIAKVCFTGTKSRHLSLLRASRAYHLPRSLAPRYQHSASESRAPTSSSPILPLAQRPLSISAKGREHERYDTYAMSRCNGIDMMGGNEFEGPQRKRREVSLPIVGQQSQTCPFSDSQSHLIVHYSRRAPLLGSLIRHMPVYCS